VRCRAPDPGAPRSEGIDSGDSDGGEKSLRRVTSEAATRAREPSRGERGTAGMKIPYQEARAAAATATASAAGLNDATGMDEAGRASLGRRVVGGVRLLAMTKRCGRPDGSLAHGSSLRWADELGEGPRGVRSAGMRRRGPCADCAAARLLLAVPGGSSLDRPEIAVGRKRRLGAPFIPGCLPRPHPPTPPTASRLTDVAARTKALPHFSPPPVPIRDSPYRPISGETRHPAGSSTSWRPMVNLGKRASKQGEPGKPPTTPQPWLLPWCPEC